MAGKKKILGTIALDFETDPIEPGLLAPRPVCLTWSSFPDGYSEPTSYGMACRPHPKWKATHGDTAGASPGKVGGIFGYNVAIGANIAYDAAVAMAEWPHLIPTIFEAYADGRVHDVQLDQRLIDNAKGQLGGWVDHNGRKHVYLYSLAELEKRHIGRDRTGDKENPDAWRLRYHELTELPFEEYPEAAREYALDDAEGTIMVHSQQRLAYPAAVFLDSAAQARAALGLHLMSCWGIMTNPAQVERFREITEERFDVISEILVEHGLVRKAGSRDTKAAKQRMVEVCTAAGVNVRLTDTGEKKCGERLVPPDHEMVVAGYVKLDLDTCEATADELLCQYAERTSLQTVVSSHIPALLKGTTTPIQARFNVMVESGRTSCSMGKKKKKTDPDPPTNGYQLQNVRRLPGIRECFESRTLLIDNDFSGLELHTFAESCMQLVGFSEMAKVLNEGRDVHLDMAASMLGISYDEAFARRHESEIQDARQFAKIANFGFPGGLGAFGLVGFARGYGVHMDKDAAAALKEQWLAKWPEAKPYFRVIRDLCGELGSAHVIQLFSRRQRGLVPYTATCNTFFQGLGADGAKRAVWEVCRRQYDPTMNSPLFNTRSVNFVHDQILAETTRGYNELPASKELRELCSIEAVEMARVMVEACNRVLPNVPVRCPPSLSKVWSKKTEPAYDTDGFLVAWDLAHAARHEVYDAEGELVIWKD